AILAVSITGRMPVLRRAQAGVQLRIAGYHPDSLGGVRFLDPDGAHRTRGIRDGVRKARRGLRFAGSGLEGVKRLPAESQQWEVADGEKQPAAPSHGNRVELTTSTGTPFYNQVNCGGISLTISQDVCAVSARIAELIRFLGISERMA